MKLFRSILSVFLVLLLLVPTMPAFAATDSSENGNARAVNNSIIIDDDPTGGYEGDYVVIYNPATSSSTSYSTGTMTGLIDTTIEANVNAFPIRTASDLDERPYKIDIDSQLNELAKSEVQSVDPAPEPVRASYSVGDTKTFRILAQYSPTGSSSVSFECLYVGQHCYIWTPVSSSNSTYPLDEIDASFAKLAADEFDSKFNLMQSSFGNHTNGSQGDGKLHMLYYNINDGWQPGQGYVAGFFYQLDISNNGLPILNIDTYPGVYYKNSAGTEYKRMDDTYNTMVHEYQHLINYSNTSGMSTWLNECFSAAAEEICYPGSSVVDRIQSWEEYYYSDSNDWLNPPKEFMYDSANSLHTGFSMYNWNNNLDNNSILALYAQVSFFAQYLFTRFGNSIYRQISNAYSSSEVNAITNATGVSCANLVRDFRVAVTANAAQNQYNGVYGFKVQNGYDPENYNNVENPWSLLGPVIFTGTSCSIKGGGAITVKPKNGVYNPPSGANSNLKYIGIKLASAYTVTAVSNNDAWGTVSVDGIRITATPATGYYVSGYEVVSGTATATVNGNIITVTPESDCTIRVIFAPKTSYTVNFVAAGSDEGSQTAFDGDAITLPSTVSVNPEGWTFSGWTDAEIPDETTQRPGYTLPGGSYTVTANTTLYALYTRIEEGAGEVGYELVTNAPTDWTGNYVITYGTNTSMYVMTGVTPSSNGAQIESASNATTYANAGVSLTDSVLSNVANSYIFKLAKHGNYYSIQSASTNAYVGEDSSSYLAGYTRYTSGNCDWTPGTLENASSATHANNGSYPLLGFSTGSGYFWSGSTSSGATAAKNVRFWKENSGNVTYYTTDPVVTAVEPAFKSQSLVLEGQIGVNFFIDLPQAAVYEYEGVDFTIDNAGGGTASVPFSPDMPTNSKGYYQFTYYVRSIEMADTITATLRYKLNGEERTLEKTYSVKQYFETYDNNKDLFTPEQQAMTEATADYGHYVQAFLDTQKNWSVGTDYAEMDKHYADYTEADITAAQTGLADYVTVKSTGTNVEKINYTLLLDSDTELRVYFKPAKNFTGTFTFTVNGETITEDGGKIRVSLQSDGRYMVSVRNIAAHELDDIYEIKALSDGDEASITVSALSYVQAIMTSYAGNATAVNAAVAIWRYATAAKALKN